ncbi:hypothetical protein AAFF_G00162690 [Aldrovandia affinis]|uniref:Uncharacterized protein n=1 Tax=Aldrovandia affinis TaxID=143900 RepID=A0AAD7WVU3_9TELE|nr:hypothetical protein AAFF_G00162690 [Aldrovandia affinis]
MKNERKENPRQPYCNLGYSRIAMSGGGAAERPVATGGYFTDAAARERLGTSRNGTRSLTWGLRAGTVPLHLQAPV